MAKLSLPLLRRRQAGGSAVVRFIGPPYVEGTNDSAVTITVFGADIGKTYLFSVASSGGGTPVTSTSTVASTSFSVVLNLTALNPGTLTVTYSEDSVAQATDTALLLAPFDVLLLSSGDRFLLEDGGFFKLSA